MKYDQHKLKAALSEIAGLDFEIHEDHTLIKVKTRGSGPAAVIDVKAMPASTEELIHVVKCTMYLRLHQSCNGFTVTREGKPAYTRSHTVETYKRADALAHMNLGGHEEEQQLVREVQALGMGVHGEAAQQDHKLAIYAKGDSKKLRDDVVGKTRDIFKNL